MVRGCWSVTTVCGDGRADGRAVIVGIYICHFDICHFGAGLGSIFFTQCSFGRGRARPVVHVSVE